MATDPMLQWQSHITDSTDRDTIISNVGVLEQFAGAITGDDSLKEKFEQIRTGIKDGTIKPTEWQTSDPFVQITSKLKESSSGKIKELDEGANKLLKRVGDAEGDIKSQGERLDTAEGSITDHGTRIKDAEDALGNKLDSSIFNNFKDKDFKTALGKKLDSSTFNNFKTGYSSWKSDLDKKLPSLASATDLDDLDKRLNNIKILLNKEVSHWTAEKTPSPLKFTPTAQVKSSTQPWGTGEDPERHADDLCTVIGEKQPDKGVSYRFVKHPTEDTYKWTKVIDNDGALALKQHSEFVTTYNTDKKNQQKDIDDLKSKFGASSSELDKLGKNFAEERRKAEERDKQYKVVVTTKGYIKDGVIVNGGSNNGTPVIVHTAHVYDNFGNEKTIEARSKLTWTINKGRTTKPVEKTVTGLVCEVSQDQFVNDGTNPHYYNIELNSNF